MDKTTAIQKLGGTAKAAAAAVGVTPSAVSQWPDVLPDRIADRVLAAIYRMSQKPADAPAAQTEEGAA
jgi:DNA-binding transcriptional regulator YdaS (Cro superfamily)